MTENRLLLDSPADPFVLFNNWFEEASEKEINDHNAMSLCTISEDLKPSSRIVLLKEFNNKGFVFYTNTRSKKGVSILNNPNVALTFHWKSLLRQIRITGTIAKVSDKDADAYYNSRSYRSRIGAWASNQSAILKNRDELSKAIEDYKKKYPDQNNVPRPDFWSGWNLNPDEIEFWLDGEDRIHQRLRYTRKGVNKWERYLLNP